jgi:hypothetical protein
MYSIPDYSRDFTTYTMGLENGRFVVTRLDMVGMTLHERRIATYATSEAAQRAIECMMRYPDETVVRYAGE